MKSLPERYVVGTLILCVSSLTAFGQLQGQEPGEPWRLSLKVGGQYSDNRDASATNKQSNLDGIVEPRVDFRYQDADRTWMQLTLTPLLKWHSHPRTAAEGAAQNNTQLFGSAEIEFMHRPTTTVTLNAGDQFAYNDDPQIIENGSTARRNQSYYRNDLHAGTEAALSEDAGVGVKVQSVTTRYQEVNEWDSDLLNGGVSPHYAVGYGWTLRGFVGMSQYQTSNADPSRGSDVMTGDVGVEKNLTKSLVAKVMGGYQAVQYDNPDLESANMINGNVELVLQAAEPTRFRLGAGYGYSPPGLNSYSAQKATTVSGEVDHDVLPDLLTMQLQGQYSDGQYEPEGVDTPGGSEKMTRLGVRGTYFASKTWTFTCGYSFEKWASELRESFNRNLVDMSVRVEW